MKRWPDPNGRWYVKFTDAGDCRTGRCHPNYVKWENVNVRGVVGVYTLEQTGSNVEEYCDITRATVLPFQSEQEPMPGGGVEPSRNFSHVGVGSSAVEIGIDSAVAVAPAVESSGLQQGETKSAVRKPRARTGRGETSTRTDLGVPLKEKRHTTRKSSNRTQGTHFEVVKDWELL